MWNERYSEPGYVYGTEPNDFLASVVDRLPKRGARVSTSGGAEGNVQVEAGISGGAEGHVQSGEPPRALCLAEGQGRNAVFLAQQGFAVEAMDQSDVGLATARALAAERGVSIHTIVADLAEYTIQPGAWDVIVSIWCHLPHELRRKVHREVVAGLRPGGVFVLEAYTPRQLEFKTGGPPTVTMLMDLESLRTELEGLELIYGVELDREVHEGTLHNGPSAVVQVLAVKPA